MDLDRRSSAAIEDYTKALYALESRGGGAVATTALADRLGVTPGSVSAMLKRLDALHLVTHSRYHGVRLTEQGRRLALEVLRHHRLIELFLAEQLGHVLGPRARRGRGARARAVRGRRGGDGREARQPDGRSPRRSDPQRRSGARGAGHLSLDAVAVGQRGVFVRVSDSDPDMLRFLSERGIAPGDVARGGRQAALRGPVFVSVDGRVSVAGRAAGRRDAHPSCPMTPRRAPADGHPRGRRGLALPRGRRCTALHRGGQRPLAGPRAR